MFRCVRRGQPTIQSTVSSPWASAASYSPLVGWQADHFFSAKTEGGPQCPGNILLLIRSGAYLTPVNVIGSFFDSLGPRFFMLWQSIYVLFFFRRRFPAAFAGTGPVPPPSGAAGRPHASHWLPGGQRTLRHASLYRKITSVVDPDPYPDWIRIQWGPWIRILIRDPDPIGQKWPRKIENSW